MPFLRIEDQDLYYRWNPAADGPVLLFIHGLGSSNSFYDPIIPSLVQKGFSCLAFDTPGSALSKYRGRDSDVDALCGAATALIASLDLDSTRVIVIGHSMGGIVASELALHMELLGVVLLGPVLPSSAVADAFATRIKTVTAEGMEPIANMIPSAATGSNSTLTQKAFIRALLLAQAPEGYVSLCKTIAGATPPRYSGIKCPMLLVAGSDDKTASMESSQKILESWGDSRKELKVLDGVGHWHCIEAAGEVGALIDAFAAGLGSTNRT